MEEKEIQSRLIEKLGKDFSLKEESLPSDPGLSSIKEHLIARIKILMASDYDRFINSLYRIDVDERKVGNILYSKDIENIPAKLAELIIERQIQRIKTQMLYKEGKL